MQKTNKKNFFSQIKFINKNMFTVSRAGDAFPDIQEPKKKVFNGKFCHLWGKNKRKKVFLKTRLCVVEIAILRMIFEFFRVRTYLAYLRESKIIRYLHVCTCATMITNQSKFSFTIFFSQWKGGNWGKDLWLTYVLIQIIFFKHQTLRA